MATSTSRETQLLALKRTAVVTLAVVAIVLGAIALFWTEASLSTIGFFFGIFLVVSGVQRAVRAFAERADSRVRFVLSIIVSVLVIVAGILSLSNTATSLVLLAAIIGVGWILGGVLDIGAILRDRAGRANWLGLAAGAVSVLAGVALLFAPLFAIAAFLKFAAVLLILIGIAALLAFPRARSATKR